MEFKDLNWTDYTVMAAVALVILALFLKLAFRKTTTFAEYIWGGRDLGIWSIAGSLIATNVSGMTFFAATEVYQFGVNIVFENVGILLLIGVIRIQAPVLYNLKLASLNEYMALRYSKKVQRLLSINSAILMLWTIIITGYSTSIFFAQITHVGLMANAVIILTGSYLLSALSGFRGVVWTDSAQTVAIFFTLVTLIIYGLIEVDRSPWEVFALARMGGRFNVDWSLDPTARLTFWSSTIGYGFQYMIVVTLLSPAMYQRYCALPDLKSVNKVAVIHTLGLVFSRLSACVLGYIMYALYAHCDPFSMGQFKKYDQILPYFLQDISKGKPFIRGIFITGYSCASFSTLTTVINTFSIAIYKDFLEEKINPSGKFVRAKRWIQLIGLIVTVVCLLAMYFLQNAKASVLELTTFNTYIPALYASVVMTGLFLPRVNSKCVFWGAAIGAIFAVFNEIGKHNYRRLPPLKPMRTDGCPYNVTATLFTTPSPDLSSEGTAFYLFRISPFYQFLMYSTLISSVMLVVSYIVGPMDYSRLDKKLISPLVHHHLPKTDASIPLNSENIAVSPEDKGCEEV